MSDYNLKSEDAYRAKKLVMHFFLPLSQVIKGKNYINSLYKDISLYSILFVLSNNDDITKKEKKNWFLSTTYQQRSIHTYILYIKKEKKNIKLNFFFPKTFLRIIITQINRLHFLSIH